MCSEKWITASFASWNVPWVTVFMMFYKYSTQGIQWLICVIGTVLYRHFRDRLKCNLPGKPSLLQFLFHKSQRDRYWKRTSSALPFWRGLIETRCISGTLCISAVLSTKEKECLHTLPSRISLLKTLLNNFCWMIPFFLLTFFFLYVWIREWIIWV